MSVTSKVTVWSGLWEKALGTAVTVKAWFEFQLPGPKVMDAGVEVIMFVSVETAAIVTPPVGSDWSDKRYVRVPMFSAIEASVGSPRTPAVSSSVTVAVADGGCASVS